MDGETLYAESVSNRAQRHLVAIRDAFVVTMPLMILGALAVLINNIPIQDMRTF